MKLCRLDDSARDVCIKNSIQSLLPEIKNNPSFFIPMDPFFHENFNGFLKNTLIDGKFAIKNVKTLGMTNALVKNVKICNASRSLKSRKVLDIKKEGGMI